MTSADLRGDFDRDGFVILPAYLDRDEIGEAVDALPAVFPTPDEFHSDPDHERHARFRSEFGGITPFPSTSTPLNLLSVHPRLIELATVLLGDDDLRSYSIELWAKYTGAADYDQALHRDYLNHSLLVPADGRPASQVEMFIYLSDVTEDLGPIALLPRKSAPAPPALPNWYPCSSGHHDEEHPDWVAADGHPDWYDHEVTATGPAGTVIAYRVETFHRGTNLVAPDGYRFTTHTNFRCASDEWITRRAWTDQANDGPAWPHFVATASPLQLQLFGFPAPGHAYWTPATTAGMTQRYPGFEPHPWLHGH